MKRQSLKLDDIDWQALTDIARQLGCQYRNQPSWRRLIDRIASGTFTVRDKPDKRIEAFQNQLRRPEQEQQLARVTARMERDRLRQEQKRRAAGIAQRSSQPAGVSIRQLIPTPPDRSIRATGPVVPPGKAVAENDSPASQ